MSITWIAVRFMVRDVKFRKFVSALTILAIATGIGAFTSLRLVSVGTKVAASNLVESVLAGEILVYGDGLCDLSELVVKDIERIPGVERVVPVVMTFGYGEGSLVIILGVRAEDLDVALSSLTSGRLYTPADSRVVIVEGGFAKERGLGPGSTMLLKPQLSASAYIYEVVGVGDIGLKVQEFGALSSYVIVPLDEVQEMLGREGYVTMAIIKVSDESLVSYVEACILQAYPDARVFRREEVMKMVTRILSVLDGLLLAVTLVGLAVAIFSTSNTVMTNVREHARDIAILKAIGARERDVVSIFLIESLFFGAIGGALGIVIGVVGADAIRGVVSSLGFLEVPLVVEPRLLVACYLTAIAVSTLSAIYPCLKASRIRPIEVLKNE